MEEWREWNGNVQTAEQIFQFFGTMYTSREDDGFLLFEGRHGGKLVVLSCPKDQPDVLGVETRTPKTQKLTGGALLHACEGLGLEASQGREKVATVYALHGNTAISKWGIVSTLE